MRRVGDELDRLRDEDEVIVDGGKSLNGHFWCRIQGPPGATLGRGESAEEAVSLAMHDAAKIGMDLGDLAHDALCVGVKMSLFGR